MSSYEKVAALNAIEVQLKRIADAQRATDDDQLPILEQGDIRTDIYRSGVLSDTFNVRLTHVPSGMVVSVGRDDGVKSQLQAQVRGIQIIRMKLQLEDWGYKVAKKGLGL